MIKIAITGNIGSGKSTITQIFENCGDQLLMQMTSLRTYIRVTLNSIADIHSINPEHK